MHPSLFYLPGVRLSLSELSAARLDGLVVEVGAGYMPADTPESVPARAASLASLARPEVAFSGPSAAWIHGAGDAAPLPHHVHRLSARRVRQRSTARLIFHDTPLGPADAAPIGAVFVTTRVRTLVDLALGCARHGDYPAWAIAFGAAFPADTARAAELLLGRARVPGRRAALRMLDEILRTR